MSHRFDKESQHISSHDANKSLPRVSLAGHVLVASAVHPPLNMERTVCIVVEHTDERAVGILLNRTLDADPTPLWEQLLKGEQVAESNSPISQLNFGGPQNGPILAIHDDQDLAEGGNDHGVYLAAQLENLKQLTLSTSCHYKIYIGHQTWGPSQLEKQIVDGHWHVIPAVPEIVFDSEESMWPKAIRTIGNHTLQSMVGIPSGTLALLN